MKKMLYVMTGALLLSLAVVNAHPVTEKAPLPRTAAQAATIRFVVGVTTFNDNPNWVASYNKSADANMRVIDWLKLVPNVWEIKGRHLYFGNVDLFPMENRVKTFAELGIGEGAVLVLHK